MLHTSHFSRPVFNTYNFKFSYYISSPPFLFDYYEAFYVLLVDFGSLSERLRVCEGNLNAAPQKLEENIEWLVFLWENAEYVP